MANQITEIDIAGRMVGPAHPSFIIAEAGVNHNGDIELAKGLVDIAAQAGADAIKFQTFSAERLASAAAPKADYQLITTDPMESQLEMLRQLELTPEMHAQVQAHCNERNILFMSSPFDTESSDLLDNLGVPVFKIPSGEITNLPYLAHIAAKDKPMIVSTGMADLSEVHTAVRTMKEADNNKFVLLQCVSNYPANPATVNLRAMETMARAFSVPVGYSDHTQGVEIPLAAVALGACVIEKHFTLDRTLPGPDQPASLEPDELTAMVRGIRLVESALGHGRKEPVASEASTAAIARKSLVAAKDIPAGTLLTEDLVAIKRPGSGLPPAMLPYMLGRPVRADVSRDSLLTLDVLK